MYVYIKLFRLETFSSNLHMLAFKRKYILPMIFPLPIDDITKIDFGKCIERCRSGRQKQKTTPSLKWDPFPGSSGRSNFFTISFNFNLPDYNNFAISTITSFKRLSSFFLKYIIPVVFITIRCSPLPYFFHVQWQSMTILLSINQ